jgi:hypothetical protein
MRRVRHGDHFVLEIEGSVPPKGAGPPLHVHLIEREEGEVVAGVLSAVVGGATIKVGAGESAVFPAGVPHRWWNAEDQPLRTKGRVVPVADLDRFLQGIFAVANAGQAGRMPLFYVAHVLYRHRRTQRLTAMPWAVRRVVFPVVVFVGWLLGKWRGRDGLGRQEASHECNATRIGYSGHLDPDMYYATSSGPMATGGNHPIIVNERDVMVVDAGTTPAAARALLEDLKKITNKPVRWVVLLCLCSFSLQGFQCVSQVKACHFISL